MIDETRDPKEMLRDILSEAIDTTENKFAYANNVQLYFGANEVTLDLYYLGPNNKPNAPTLQAQRLHRAVLPVAVAKEMAELLLNGIAKWEADFGITLPLEPENLSNRQEEIGSNEGSGQ